MEDYEEWTPYSEEQEAAQVKLQAAMEEWASVMGITDEEFFLDQWFLIGNVVNPMMPHCTRYFRGYANGHQAPHVTAGLLRYATIHNDDDISDVSGYGADDDD
jgi:hypothetical protein